jgi:hypothetical protein
MDVIAGAEDEGRHFRVPAVALMAEVHASFQKLTHIECRQCHARSSCFPVDPPPT